MSRRCLSNAAVAADLLPQRIPEPELMDEPAQAAAYAGADFEQPHAWFVQQLCETFPAPDFAARVVDLGCGAADITVRVARAWPECNVDGVDGAGAMLEFGHAAVAAAGLEHRIRLLRTRLPSSALGISCYQAVVSNSLLHHLHDPQVLWAAVRQLAAPGCRVFIMDLMRPPSPEAAAQLVRTHSGAEPEILRRDFYNSLLAAFRPREVQQQLREVGLDALQVRAASDRHLIIHGVLP